MYSDPPCAKQMSRIACRHNPGGVFSLACRPGGRAYPGNSHTTDVRFDVTKEGPMHYRAKTDFSINVLQISRE